MAGWLVCAAMLACAIGVTALAANEASAAEPSERGLVREFMQASMRASRHLMPQDPVVAQQVRPEANALDLQARKAPLLRDDIEPLTYPAWGVTPQKSTIYNAGDDLTFGGISRLSRVETPGGSGHVSPASSFKAMSAPSRRGPKGSTSITPIRTSGLDFEYWFCFAVRTKSGEYPATNDGVLANNVHLVRQTHTQGKGTRRRWP